MTKQGLTYRPDIDGLRAVAILGVLVFHIWPEALPGGFLGVDVFFVISGFLITAIIQRSIEKGVFSILEFYERRIRRIIPALFFMFLIVTLAACRWLLPVELEEFGKSMKYAVLSIGNFHFLNTSLDYFNEAGDGVPLLHTWSLAVEEQFYFAFPLLLLGLNKWIRSRFALLGVLVVILLVSYTASLWMMRENAMVAFYMLPFRAWEMLLGAVLALARIPVPNRVTADVAGMTGLALIIVSVFWLSDLNLPVNGGAIIPCLGAGLLLYAGGNRQSAATRILALRPLAGLGLISYSVYLWHWPLIIFFQRFFPVTGISGWGLLVVSVGAGWASWRYVERPFRESGALSRRSVYFRWLAASLALLAADMAIQKSDGWVSRYSPEVRHYLDYKKSPGAIRNNTKRHYDPAQAVRFGDASAVATIALWGDSHADALVPELDRLAKEAGKAFWHFGMASQPPLPGVVPADQSNGNKRERYTAGTLARILSDQQIKVVVLHARWGFYIRGRNERSGDVRIAFRGQPPMTAKERELFFGDKLRATVAQLIEAGKTVVLIYPVPEVGYNVPDFLAKQVVAGNVPPVEVDCPDFEERQGAVMAVMDALPGDIIRIRPHERLLTNARVRIVHDNEPLYRDDDHLGAPGVAYLRGMFDPIFSDRSAGNQGVR